MPKARLVVAHATIAVLLVGACFDIVTGTEHWPFSPYAMFSEIKLSRTATKLALIGIAEDQGSEIPLAGAWAASPMGAARLADALQLILAGTRGQERTELIVKELLARYERRRLAGQHAGPRLALLRLYRLEWDLDLPVLAARPADRRTLLVEMRRVEDRS